MEFVKHDQTLAGTILPAPTGAPPGPPVPFEETLGTAFRLENDVVNAIEAVTRPTIPPQQNFDVTKYGEEKYGDFWLDHYNILGGAQSPAEMDALAARIRSEQKDRQLLASQGWSGIIAGMAAGMFSPTMFIPLTGPSRGVKGVAEAFALAGLASSAQEATLFANQLTRTPKEAAVSIAAGTVLGGLLGSGAKYFSRTDFDALAAGLDMDRRSESIPEARLVATAGGGIEREGVQRALQIEGGPQEDVYRGFQKAFAEHPGDPVTGLRMLRSTMAAAGGPESEAFKALEDSIRALPEVKELEEKLWRTAEEGDALEADNVVPFGKKRDAKEELSAKQEVALDNDFQVQELNQKVDKLIAEKMQVALKEVPPRPESPPPNFEAGRSVGAEDARRSRPHSSFDEADVPTEAGKVAKSVPVIGDIAAGISPVLRSINQEFSPALRHLMSRLADAGVMMENNRFGIAHAPGGTVEDRLGFYQSLRATAIEAAEDGYVDYVLGGVKATLKDRAVVAARKFLNSSVDGKMKFSEFKERITDALNLGDKSDIPEVQKAANTIREVYKKVWDAMEAASDETGYPPMLGKVDLREGESFLNHIYDESYVATHKGDFIVDVSRWINEQVSQDFQTKYDELLAKVGEDEDVAKLLDLGAEEAGKMYDELKQQLDALSHPAEANPVLDDAARLRREARALADTEFERLEARYNPHSDPEISKEHRGLAGRSTAERAKALRAEARRLEENLPPAVKETLEQRKVLRKQMRLLNRSFGRRTARAEEMQSDIARLEGRNIETLAGLSRAFKRFDEGLARWSDEKLDFQLKKLEEQFDTIQNQIEKSEAKLEKLYEDLGTEFEPTERISIEEAKNALLKERLGKVLERIPKEDRVARRAAVKQQLDNALLYANKIIKRRNARQDFLREKLREADPAIAQNEARALRTKANRQLDEFLESGTARGIERGENGAFDFSAEAERIATKLANRITGSSGRMFQLDTLMEERGSGFARYLNLPYEVKRQYLQKDIEKVVDVYMRSLGPDIEIYRATGAVNGDGPNGLQAVRADMDRYSKYLQTRVRTKPDLVKEDGTVVPQGKLVTPAMREKDLAEFERMSAAHMANLRGVIDRLRNVRGIPSNPDGWGYRMGRMFLNWNVSSMMGTAFITSVPDAARGVMVHGLQTTFRDGYYPFIKGLISKDVADQAKRSQIQRELKLMGIGIDTWLGSRANAMLDIFNTYSRQSKPERFFEWTARMTPRVAMFGQWTDVMQTIVGGATMARLVRGIQDISHGRADSATIQYLASVGMDEQTVRRIWKQLDTPNGGTRYADWRKVRDPDASDKYDDLVLPNIESWDDLEAARAFSAAMHHEVRRIIVTPGVEKPLWADETMAGRLLYQFRSFTFSSTQKMLLSGLQQRDMALFNVVQGTMFSLALGTLSYYIYGLTVGGQTREKMLDADWRTWADQAIYRSGMLGAFGEAQTIGGELPALRPYLYFSDRELAGRRPEGVMEAVLGPSYSKAGTLATVLAGFDQPTQGTAKQVKQLIPWQNVFWLRQGFDYVTQQAANAANLPETRQ
jgi:hypothetical protein